LHSHQNLLFFKLPFRSLALPKVFGDFSVQLVDVGLIDTLVHCGNGLQPKAHHECAWCSEADEETPPLLIERLSIWKWKNRDVDRADSQPFRE
jgi:hypothetical protein